MREGFTDPGGASNLVAAQCLLVVPTAVYDFNPGILCPCYLAKSLKTGWTLLATRAIIRLSCSCSIAFIYYLNQRAVRAQLEPRRQELLALLASLGDETTGEEHATTSSAKSVESPGMLRRWLIVAVSVPRDIRGDCSWQAGYSIPAMTGLLDSSGPAGDSLARLITDLRKEKNLVGLAAMVMVDGQVEAAAADGERKKGSGVPLEIGDRWHLGGITKSITATMIARLVESGQMQWSDTIGEIFPEASIHEDWKPVTLRQLLTDTAGAPRTSPKRFGANGLRSVPNAPKRVERRC